MRFTILLFVLRTAQTISASKSFYFVTHDLYTTNGLSAAAISSSRVKGDNATVTQQCRRTCAQSLPCKAYQVTLLQGVAARGTFNCSFYDLNACDYRNTALKLNMGRRMWDKIDATLLKPKACYDYCPVAKKGDCTRCEAPSNFTGLDCEIAPKLCSDYTAKPDVPTFFPIWPWGFGGRKLTVMCKDRETVIIRNYFNTTGVRTVLSLGFNTPAATSLPIYTAAIQNIDWSLISELQSLFTEKKLFVRVTLDSLTENHIFSGLKISPTGELSLNASLTGSIGFPTPFSKAPFVNSPFGYGFDCGPFWRFTTTTNVCDQRTKLLNYGNFVWNGQTSIGLGSVVLSFK